MSQIARSQKQIGSILRRCRHAKNMTQDVLAQLAGARQATISDLENGQTDTKLATLLDVLAALDLELVVQPRSQGSQKDLEDLLG